MEQDKKFKWGKLYSVHNLDMDRQHKYLFEMVNQFNELKILPDNDIRTRLPGFLTELYKFTEMHFREEEKILDSLELPSDCVGRHKDKHRALLHQLQELAKELTDSFSPELGDKTSDFLRHWLMDHILATDKRYGERLDQLNRGEATVEIVCNESFHSVEELFRQA